MNIGSLNKRIALLKPDKIPDGGGGLEPNPDNPSGYLKIAEVWADMQKPKLRTEIINGGLAVETLIVFWIRYFPKIEKEWQVVCDEKTYKVLNVYSEQNRKTVVLCREVSY